MKTLMTIATALAFATALQGQGLALQIATPIPALSRPAPTATPAPVASPSPDDPIEQKILHFRAQMAASSQGRNQSETPEASNRCAVVATAVYVMVEGSYWREIIDLRGTFPDGRKFMHQACVWIPMKGANAQIYDERFATIELPTKETSKEEILRAMQKVWGTKRTFTEIHFLDEKMKLTVEFHSWKGAMKPEKIAELVWDGEKFTGSGTKMMFFGEPIKLRDSGQIVTTESDPELFMRSLWLQYKSPYFMATKAVEANP
jgi:hypothetical protein